MAAFLALQLVSPGEKPMIDAHFNVLSEALQPAAQITIEDATQTLLDTLPDQSVSSVADFLEAYYDAAEQIPHTQPS